MTRTEALDLDSPISGYQVRNAFGIDGQCWYEAHHCGDGSEWTARILFRIGVFTWHSARCELEPDGVDWVPGELFPDGPPDLPFDD